MINFKLNNGNSIPAIGLGTYKTTGTETVAPAIKAAIDNNLTLIDTASMYQNEKEIGEAIKETSVNRNNLFITTKVWNADQGYSLTLKSFENSLKNLQTNYIDLYLIHWPVSGKFNDTWKALEYLYEQGVAKNIGVSNFHKHHLEKLFTTAKIRPLVNQVELHPYMNQQELREYCKQNDIIVEAWSPIAKGKVLQDELLNEIAKKYGKTAIQVTLRWEIQLGIITIPKSTKPERISQFSDIFDFELTNEEIKQICKLDKGLRLGPNPDDFNF